MASGGGGTGRGRGAGKEAWSYEGAGLEMIDSGVGGA